MAERGSTSRAGAQAATLATRKAKDYGARPESLAAEWHARADALGFDAAARTRLLGRLPARLPEPADLLRASAELLSPAGLTGKASAFTRPDATRGWCVRLPQGAPRARTHMHAAGFLAGPSLTVPVGRYTDRTFTSRGPGHRPPQRLPPRTGQRPARRRRRRGPQPEHADRPDRRTRPERRRGHLRDGGLDHGYALTVHQAQGLTGQRAMFLGSDALYREAGYVGLSRGRQRNDLHLLERAAPDNPASSHSRSPLTPQAGDTWA